MSETGRRVAIIGGSQGIGADLVARYRGRGWAVVDAIMFLESSPYITGEILHVDGGQIAGHRPLGPASSGGPL